MASQTIFLALAITMIALTMPVYGQVTTSCTPSMLTSFSPCISFISNSSANGTAPSSDCCNSLSSVMSNGTDCLCLIATGTVPNLQNIPINRTLAVSLPRACNMPGVPLQCKAASAPIPAPGPAALNPTPSASTPTGSAIPESLSPSLAPESDANSALTPPSTTGAAGAPTTNTDSRPVLNPSAAAKSSHGLSSSLVLFVLGATILKYY